ncbi:MAG TPA: outer membrane lipoprotein carrier protein LolA [Syntrophales bacterium]|jgi:outer membrane lipoprotein carrier protein|nr:outer membrane lipoprotein carrier protein LolA [Syntrophales bacterium]HOX94332.1 outer membrane lipoprotein carrier protein LolA [Syntrophales bacterium]HPI57579.1 outer membrane lipoprotein carrier protein LolA [Syntrophales bacterium]HPN24736.1 outer membrane lipoprotein carrier protein LolA [Syntrophales bacterium]HQM29866.1 outer membrane lipoprotein carrier protein LolA [Syntrophales bacterium]
MTASALLLLTAFFAAVPSLCQAQEVNLETLVLKIQETYERTDDFKSAFTQETTIKSLNKTERESGVVYFKKPRKMRWVYSKPKSKELVIGPLKSWLYIPEDRMAYLQDSESLLKSKVTVKFMSGIGKLAEDFDIRYAESGKKEGSYRLELKPKAYVEGVEKLFLTVNRQNYQITSVLLTDVYGNVTKTTFSNTEFNRNLPDRLFTFKPPAGVDVVDLNKKH